MAIVKIKIHPAIGIARVGNSPCEFFIGPERRWDHNPPPGGYKDDMGRIKRQAACFRLFGYDEHGQVVVDNTGKPKEITAADATIEWTVHLANKKAAAPRFSGSGNRNPSVPSAERDGLHIDPGPRTLAGLNQQAEFDTGVFTFPNQDPAPVYLGEIRTDADGRLIVLGGHGAAGSPTGKDITTTFDNDAWYDDTSDGPITAKVTLTGETKPLDDVEEAWVIVAPPKFAPPVDNIITLHDTLFDLFVHAGSLSAPTTPSFNDDIYPILQSTLDMKWVNKEASAHHLWEPSEYPRVDGWREPLFAILKKPGGGGGTMPKLKDLAPSSPPRPLGGNTLTRTQYDNMQKWKDLTFTDDWPGHPPAPVSTITPDGLDRAALENCVGGAFYPGIEAGAFLIEDASRYKAPFRLDHTKVKPGDVTARMALPWQTDFYACNDNWWPAQRPNQAIPAGKTDHEGWARGVTSGREMVDKWYTLGFVVVQGTRMVETARSNFITARDVEKRGALYRCNLFNFGGFTVSPGSKGPQTRGVVSHWTKGLEPVGEREVFTGEVVEMLVRITDGVYPLGRGTRVRFDILEEDYLLTGELDDFIVSYVGPGTPRPADFTAVRKKTQYRCLQPGETLKTAVEAFRNSHTTDYGDYILLLEQRGAPPVYAIVAWWTAERLEDYLNSEFYFIVNVDDRLEDQSDLILDVTSATQESVRS